MNISQEVINICRKFIRQGLERGELIDFEKVIENLNLNFYGDWSILITKEEILNWYENIYEFKFLNNLTNAEELIIHSSDNCMLIQKTSRSTCRLNISQIDLELSLELLCLKEKIDWNFNSPFVSFKTTILTRNARISLTNQSLSGEHSHKVSIRFHSHDTFELSSFLKENHSAEVITKIFKDKENILISGSTGSGKTSFIGTLLSYSKENDHIFVLEDTHEIRSPNKSTTRLISKEKIGYELKDYCNYALRMRPDRIILGEIRSKEATPFILNANNGHKGLVSTIHANSAQEAPQRLATLLTLYSGISGMNNDLALDLICSGIDYIFHMENKKIKQIIKLLNCENGIIHFDDILVSTCEHPLGTCSFAS